MCALPLWLATPPASAAKVQPLAAGPDIAAASGIVWGVGLGAILWAMLFYALRTV